MNLQALRTGILAGGLGCYSLHAAKDLTRAPPPMLDVDRLLSNVQAVSPLQNAGLTTQEAPLSEYRADASFEQKRLLAHDWLGRNRARDALPVFEELLRLQPADKSSRLGYGTALIAVKRYGDAVRVHEQLLAEYPTDYSTLNNLAWLYATASDPLFRNGKRAAALAQQALLIAPVDYHVWSTLAEAYYIQGDYVRAERTAKEALNLATRIGVPEKLRLEYVQQLDRCQRAAQALQIME